VNDTPLHQAAWHGHARVAAALLAAGADVRASNQARMPPPIHAGAAALPAIPTDPASPPAAGSRC